MVQFAVLLAAPPIRNHSAAIFHLGGSPFLLLYGLSAIILGIFGFYAASAMQPMFLSGMQQDLASKAYGGMLTTLATNNLIFFLPSIITFLGIWLLGFKGALIVDADNRLISKRYSCFLLTIWSKAWAVQQLQGISCGPYGSGLVSSKIFQIRLTSDGQTSKAILMCGGAFRDPLRLMAEKIAILLDVPLSSNRSKP